MHPSSSFFTTLELRNLKDTGNKPMLSVLLPKSRTCPHLAPGLYPPRALTKGLVPWENWLSQKPRIS